MSGPEVRKFFKIWTVRKLNVFFFPDAGLLKLLKIIIKKKFLKILKNSKNFLKRIFNFFFKFCLFVYFLKERSFNSFIWYVNCSKKSGFSPVRQIWVSGPVRWGNSYAQSGWALIWRDKLHTWVEGLNRIRIPRHNFHHTLPRRHWHHPWIRKIFCKIVKSITVPNNSYCFLANLHQLDGHVYCLGCSCHP